ncbi:hypothetical protein G9A89_010877 [Geosiphon pyriformis]|nr:hypothetical protein G9A89_010877 [Geosiphon pyriformis]
MYHNEPLEQRRVRSVVASVGGRSSQRRSNAITTTSRLFMTAVKDASRSARSEGNGDRADEYMTKAQLAKRPYSPTSDFRIDDDRFQHKARKIETDSAPEQFRSYENNSYNIPSEHNQRNLQRQSPDRMNNRSSPARNSSNNANFTPERQINQLTPDRVNVVQLTPDRPSPELMYETPPRPERPRYFNERRLPEPQFSFPPQFNFEPPRPFAQPRSVLDRLGKKGGMTTAYINPAFFHNPAPPITDVDMMGSHNITDSIVLGPKLSRCRHWPNCDLGAACKFHHPTEICGAFPNCPNSDRTCLYIHPATDAFDPFPIRRPFMPGPSLIKNNFQRPSTLRRNHLPRQSMGSSFSTNQPSYSSTQTATVLKQNGEKGTTNGESTNNPKNVITTSSANTSQTTLIAVPPAAPTTTTSSSTTSIQANPTALCKFGEACAKPTCVFAHASPASIGTGAAPSVLLEVGCKYDTECTNPKCKFAHSSPAMVMLTQEPCRYYPNCANQNCPYLHLDYNDESMKVPTPCRKGATCTRADCYFLHPWDMEISTGITCKFGVLCRRPDCKFLHPNGKSKSEFGSVISEHSFTVDDDEVEEDVIGENGVAEAEPEDSGSKKDVVIDLEDHNEQTADENSNDVSTNKIVDEFHWDDNDDLNINDLDNMGDLTDYLIDGE